MIDLVSECNNFMKDCGFSYAVCGGYALELFLCKKLRPHSDIDLSVFEQDKANMVSFLLNKGWNTCEILTIDIPSLSGCLRFISNPGDEKIAKLNHIWAIKPGCSIFELEQEPGAKDVFNFKIVNNEQLNFDFIEIIFNKQKDGNFVFDSSAGQGKNITRELDKAILFSTGGVPYLAPEVKLFILSNPEYSESDYHKAKNQIDFDSTVSFLPKESRTWLINALETAYPNGHKRIGKLKGDIP